MKRIVIVFFLIDFFILNKTLAHFVPPFFRERRLGQNTEIATEGHQVAVQSHLTFFCVFFFIIIIQQQEYGA